MMCSTWGQVCLIAKYIVHPMRVHMLSLKRESCTYRYQSLRHGYSCVIMSCSLPASFLEDGHLHRAVRIGAKLSVLEDLALFPDPQPVENMKLYKVSRGFGGASWGDI